MTSDWFDIWQVQDEVYVIEERGHVQSYLVNGSEVSALIDTGTGFGDLRAAVQPLVRDRVMALNTHWHYDHIGGNADFDRVGIHRKEEALLSADVSGAVRFYLEMCGRLGWPLPEGVSPEGFRLRPSAATFVFDHGDRFDLGGRTLEAIHAPGHSPGSTCFLDSLTGALFVGDVVYEGSLYAQFEDADLGQYVATLRMLARRENSFGRIYPGHGPFPLLKGLMGRALELMERVVGGALLGQEVTEPWGPCVLYEWRGLSAYDRLPNSAGLPLIGG
jgi:glyoxylase-like metal-dependent hydrolase (beta-lactamase superfamily II)